jgi:hypothetical protein
MYGVYQIRISGNMVCDKYGVDGVCWIVEWFPPFARVSQTLLDTLYISIYPLTDRNWLRIFNYNKKLRYEHNGKQNEIG